MKANIKSTYRLIQSNIKRLILLEVLYKLIFFFLIIPFISLGFNFALNCTKYSYLTTENIFRFMMYPQTVLVILLIVVIITLFIQIETCSLFYFFEDCKNHKKHNLAQLLIAGVRSMCSLMKRRCFLVSVYALFMSIFLNIPMIVLVISQAGIPSYLIKSFFSLKYAKLSFLAVMLLMLVISCRRIFVLPICILDKRTYKDARKICITYMKGNHLSLMTQMLAINVFLITVYLLIYCVCLGILLAGINLFAARRIAIPLFLQNYEQLNRIIFVCVSILGAAVNYAMVSNLYVRASKPKIKELVEDEQVPKLKLRSNIRKQLKRIGILMACLCALTTYSYFYNMLRNGTFNAEEALLGIQVTAHRGNSREAPENTIPAIQRAIDCYSDYAEIDVQLTKDGEVVLCHDLNLYRTGGVKVKVGDLTYEELLQHDVGTWFSDEYTGTKVPTLAEVLKLCKGKIKLNIELKRIGRQQELVERVVALIQENDFQRQCVITSMSYEALKMVKLEDDSVKTGYIMSLAYGNFYENENIDFFSMKESIVTEDIVKKAHRLGKEIHVWTVNSRNTITRLAALGVDNIITDRPVFVQEVLYDTEGTSLFSYVRMIMK